MNNYDTFNSTEFRNLVKIRRERMNLSQHDFALMVGMKPNTYSKSEKGDRNFSIKDQESILKALEDYDNNVYSKRLDKAIELLTDIKNHNYFYISDPSKVLSAVGSFLAFVDNNV